MDPVIQGNLDLIISTYCRSQLSDKLKNRNLDLIISTYCRFEDLRL